MKKLRRELEAAEAVVVGAGAGLSTSAGFTYSGERFRRLFPDFIRSIIFQICIPGAFIPLRP